MESNICPYLGLIDDPKTGTTYPDQNNACHRIQPPVLINPEYQSRNCLRAAYQDCPGYVNGWKEGIPKDISRRRPITTKKLLAGWPYLLATICVILVIWAGLTGQLSGIGNAFGLSARNKATNTSTPTLTRTLTPTFTLTNTFTPTPPTDTPTASPTATHTATETATATRFYQIFPTDTPAREEEDEPEPATQPPPTKAPTKPPPTKAPPKPTKPPVQPTETPPPTETPIPPPDIRTPEPTRATP